VDAHRSSEYGRRNVIFAVSQTFSTVSHRTSCEERWAKRKNPGGDMGLPSTVDTLSVIHYDVDHLVGRVQPLVSCNAGLHRSANE
jgi:hypothetical protein